MNLLTRINGGTKVPLRRQSRPVLAMTRRYQTVEGSDALAPTTKPLSVWTGALS